jgi:hypothetical protein
MMTGWVGVDLDGTLAKYDAWLGPTEIGPPVKPMVARVKKWLAEGRDVRIFTARVAEPEVTPEYLEYVRRKATEAGKGADFDPAEHVAQWSRDIPGVRRAIEDWCEKHVGARLRVTNIKDFGMVELWDDRAIQVTMNVGTPVLPCMLHHGRMQ